jgi:DNA gyrase subunit B
MKQLITEGHVYMGMPPLYRVQKGDKITYCYDDAALKKATVGLQGYTVQRYKGLGEMNAEQLWETTMNPAARTLVRVDIEDAANVERLVTLLMGEKVQPRKEYISKNANFNKTDTFTAQLAAAGREAK